LFALLGCLPFLGRWEPQLRGKKLKILKVCGPAFLGHLSFPAGIGCPFLVPWVLAAHSSFLAWSWSFIPASPGDWLFIPLHPARKWRFNPPNTMDIPNILKFSPPAAQKKIFPN
jgi:hypothetical protein